MDSTADISLQSRCPVLQDQHPQVQSRILLNSEADTLSHTQASYYQQVNNLQAPDIQFTDFNSRVRDLEDRINKDFKWLRCWFFVQIISSLANGIYKMITGFPIIHQTVALLFLFCMYGSGIQGMVYKDLSKAQCCYLLMSIFTVFLAIATLLSAVSCLIGLPNGPQFDEGKLPFLSSFNKWPVSLISVFSAFFIVFLVTNLLPSRRVRDILKERLVYMQNTSTINSSINSEL